MSTVLVVSRPWKNVQWISNRGKMSNGYLHPRLLNSIQALTHVYSIHAQDPNPHQPSPPKPRSQNGLNPQVKLHINMDRRQLVLDTGHTL